MFPSSRPEDVNLDLSEYKSKDFWEDVEYNFDHACTPPSAVLDDDELPSLNLPEVSSSEFFGDSLNTNSGFGLNSEPLPSLSLTPGQNCFSTKEDTSIDYLFSSCSLGGNDTYAKGEKNLIDEFHNPQENLDCRSITNSNGGLYSFGGADTYEGVGGNLNIQESFDLGSITNSNEDSYSSALSSDSMNQYSLSDQSCGSYYPENCSSTSSYASPEPVMSSHNSSKRSRKSLVDMTDDEKYLRIREQNNIASKEYRKRRKGSTVAMEQQVKELLTKNQHLKECSQNLECQYEQCLRVRKMLEHLGYKQNWP